MNGVARGRWQCWIILVCFSSAAALLLQAEPAHAEPPASVSVGVERLPGGDQAIIRLTATAGEKDAAFGFEYELPSWPFLKKVQGSPLIVRSVAMVGPGTLRGAKAPGIRPYLPTYRGMCMRPRPREAQLLPLFSWHWVEIPAGSVATVEILVEASFPSWPGTSYDVDLSLFHADEASAPHYPFQTVSMPDLAPAGTHIRMTVVGSEGSGTNRRGSPAIVGTTAPPLRSARIALRAVPVDPRGVFLDQWRDKSSVRLGAVRTDRQGHFRLPMRPISAAGRFVFMARSQARESRAADWNCGPVFTVEP